MTIIVEQEAQASFDEIIPNFDDQDFSQEEPIQRDIKSSD